MYFIHYQELPIVVYLVLFSCPPPPFSPYPSLLSLSLCLFLSVIAGEYMQYMQMYNCAGPNCLSCKLHHPSCVGLGNGRQPVPLRTDILMVCKEGRTISIVAKTAATTSAQQSGRVVATSSVSGNGSLPVSVS